MTSDCLVRRQAALVGTSRTPCAAPSDHSRNNSPATWTRHCRPSPAARSTSEQSTRQVATMSLPMARQPKAKGDVIVPFIVSNGPRSASARLAFHQHGPATLRALALVHDAEAFGNFGIGLEQAAEVAAKAVLVELLVRLDVPEPAGVGRNLIRHHDPHQVVLPQPPGLHLEVDQADADAEEHA